MKRIAFCFVVLTVTLVASEVPVVQRIEDAIRAAEPGWQCQHAVLDAPPPVVPSEKWLVASVWRYTSKTGNRETVIMLISQVESRSDAHMSLDFMHEQSMHEGKVASGWKVKTYSLGDEAYLATNGSRYEIHFRKDRVIVRVKTDSILLAERFAKDAEAQISAN